MCSLSQTYLGTQSNIYDGALLGNSLRLKACKIYHKKAPSQIGVLKLLQISYFSKNPVVFQISNNLVIEKAAIVIKILMILIK